MSDSTGNKQRLLIVDDSKVIRVTARKILRDHFETVEAADGEQAWEILNSETLFSVVVSDLTMPELDGFGLLERIRNSQQPHIKDIPVIVITGANDTDAVKQRASRAGATDFIGKPFDSVNLLARTQAHASANAVTRSLTEKLIELEGQAMADPLTGLANEVVFMERGYQQLSYAIRHETSLSIFRVGIDHYGDLYKQHGKETSEAVIKTVASVLKTSIRYEDIVARTGSAHFSLLLPGMNKYGIHTLADRIIRGLDGRILKRGDKRIHISVSIGIVAPDIRRDTRFDELLKLANERLFEAIKQGGNRVVFRDNVAKPAPFQDSVNAAAPVAVMSDEAITEMLARSADDLPELEEIELASPDISTEQAASIWNSSTTIESRSKEPSEPLPGQVAGPVPGTAAPVTPHVTAAKSAAPATSNTPPPGAAVSAPPTGRAVFTVDETLEGADSIVIAAPPDADPIDNPPPVSEASRTGTAAHIARPLISPETRGAEPPARRGVFRSMLRGIGSLFGRSRRR